MSDTHALQIANYTATTALIDELVRAGTANFVVCPGSRSTPLALTVARHPGARLWMHLDERSAAFFALGMAKASGKPVAIVCSSGTAAANFLPAVVEAFYARVPLVVLTADRPHELRDAGAPQTIDQLRLYGSHAKWFVDLPEPDAAPEMVRYVRTVAGKAVAIALAGPAGPVHLNCPYREPLMPPEDGLLWAGEERVAGDAYLSVVEGARTPSPAQVEALVARLAGVEHGLIICGPVDAALPSGPVTRLAQRLGFPILADALSGVRCAEHNGAAVLDCYDAVLRDAAFAERFAPEVVLRFGAMPTAKPVLQYLERHAGCRQIVVDGDGGWNEPMRLAAEVVHADADSLCEALLEAVPARNGSRRSEWERAWQAADRLAREAIEQELGGIDELFEGKVFAELAALLPDGATLYAGNSMPVRDLDTFFPGSERDLRCFSNRGANGIDGVVSSALGAAAVTRPLVLVIGDVSFYHDANGLLAAKQHNLDATIVLLNNDGGGIFSFLSQSSEPEHFEQLWGTPHGLDFRPLAEMYGATFSRVSNWEEFRQAVGAGVGGNGLHIVEVPTERNRNVALHRRMWPAVSEALANGLLKGAAV